jgi:hypothetical protein
VKELTSWAFKVKFFVIGAANGINGILIIFANPHVSGILQVRDVGEGDGERETLVDVETW